jgi:hypothetical protein
VSLFFSIVDKNADTFTDTFTYLEFDGAFKKLAESPNEQLFFERDQGYIRDL